MSTRRLLESTAACAADFLDSLAHRSVEATATVEELRAALGGPLPEGPTDPEQVVAELAAAAEPGVVGRPVAAFASEDNNKPAFFEPGVVAVFTCTVTGV